MVVDVISQGSADAFVGSGGGVGVLVLKLTSITFEGSKMLIGDPTCRRFDGRMGKARYDECYVMAKST